MALFLFRFFPALIPLIVYLIWLYVVRRRARKAGTPEPRFSDGPIYWLVISSLGIAMLCFIVIGFSMDGHKGDYEPPHMENGTLIPGRVKE